MNTETKSTITQLRNRLNALVPGEPVTQRQLDLLIGEVNTLEMQVETGGGSGMPPVTLPQSVMAPPFVATHPRAIEPPVDEPAPVVEESQPDAEAETKKSPEAKPRATSAKHSGARKK